MTETLSRPVSERSVEAPTIIGAPEALQLRVLDQIVGRDQEIRDAFEAQNESTDYDSFKQQKINELLAEQGLTDSEDEAGHQSYVRANDIYQYVSGLSNVEWLTRPEGSDMQRRNIVFQQIIDEYMRVEIYVDESNLSTEDAEEATQADTEQEEGSEEAETDDTRVSDGETSDDAMNVRLEELTVSLTDAREKWATASAKRSGKLWSGKNNDNQDLEKSYNEAVRAHGNATLQDILNDESKTQEEKNAAVVAYLFEEQARLRDLTTEKLNGTKVGKFVEWINTGTKWQRAGKGVLVGVGGALGGSVLAGALGAGVVTAGAIGFARFARGYAQHDKRGVRSLEEREIEETAVVEAMTDEQNELERQKIEREHQFVSATRHMNYLYEDETIDQQKKRRKAFAWGAGSVAVGGLLGYAGFFGASQAMKEATNFDLQIFHPLGEYNIDFFESDGDLNLTEDWSHDGSSEVDGNPGGWPDIDTTDGVNDGNGWINHPDAPTMPDIDIDPDTPDSNPDPASNPDSNVDNGDHSDIEGDTNDNMNVVTVEAGHGYTHELMDFAEANGQELSPQQAYNLHLALVEEFGADYINIDGAGDDIYYEGQDIRLSEPGVGRWEKGVPEFTVKYMNDHGLWTQNPN